MKNKRLTITDVAKAVGITPRTIMRWEKSGKIKRPKRDWRGWRFYHEEDIGEIKNFFESCYEFETENGRLVDATKALIIVAITITAFLSSYIICGPAYATANFEPKRAAQQDSAVTETPSTIDIHLDALPAVEVPPSAVTEDVKYTLGPNDVIEIEVRRHPEFSGQYAVNSEGKIEYKFVGDVVVTGLTKAELNQRLAEILSEYIIDPEIDVRIIAYLSKVFYVVGDVYQPGKFYMRGNVVTVREALVQAGLPTQSAAMRRCRIITPDEAKKNNYIEVDVFGLLYEGDLKENLEMNPGDVLYVPATVIAKIIRVISPVTTLTGETVGAAARGAFLIP